jgi:CRISPR type III-A-associated RAMP protein Csm5
MSNYILKTLFKLKTLTPVHISDGHEGDIIPSEYIISDSGQLHKINLSILIEKLPADLLSELTDLMDKEDFVGIRNFIQSVWKKSSNIFADCIEYSMNAGDVKSYYDNLPNENVESQLLITPFIRSARELFLPGSSIKGSIRTALISNFAVSIDIKPYGKSVKYDAQMLESDVLKYSYKDKNGNQKFNVIKDPLKSLKISDSSALPIQGTVKKVEVINKDKYGKFNDDMKGAKIFAEFIDSGVEIDIEARLDTRYFTVENGVGRTLSFNDIRNSCKAFYKLLLTHERDKFFKDFDRQIKISHVSKLYDDFLLLNEGKNSFLIRIGKHSGRNSLSLNLINKKGVEPKSRKFIIKDGVYLPIGWVKVTVSE